MTKAQLCGADELAPGAMRRFELDGQDPILLCNLDGAFQALEDECTHAIASLSEGRLEGGVIFCPMHGGSFDARTGKAMSLPCKQALRTFAAQVVEGQVWIDLD